MTESTIFNEAIDAIRNGENDRARDLLSRLLRTEKENSEYWLWMSSVVFSSKEKIYCLKNVLQLDPTNIHARKGLTLLGAIPPDNVHPSPPIKRVWKTNLAVEELQGWQNIMAIPIARVLVFLVVALTAVGLILAGIFGIRGGLKPQLTITPIAWTNTPTTLPTETPNLPSVTPVFTPTPQPLWMLLDATYTPVPLYVNTPHPRHEAYRLAIRAYERGNIDRMINFLEQTLEDEPEAVDVHYYLGEAYLSLGDYERAIQYYDDALKIDPNFAPVYLSRALLRRSINSKIDVIADLDKAIERDPLYGEAFLQRAISWFEAQEYEKALEDLNAASRLIPYDPRLYMKLAEVNLALGENQDALENAQAAHELDITLLQAYLVLGKANLANGKLTEARKNIETYGVYAPEDAMHLALLGAVLYEIGDDYEAVFETLDRAKSLDDDLADIYYYHGLTSLELGDIKQAVNDFYIARNLEEGNPEYGIWFGIALYEDERFSEAYSQFNLLESFKKSDEQLVKFYYYKAKAGAEISLIESVKDAWLSLLDMPEELVPAEWIEEAELYLAPPTATPTPTQTFTPKVTFTATSTPSSTLPPSPTKTLDLPDT